MTSEEHKHYIGMHPDQVISEIHQNSPNIPLLVDKYPLETFTSMDFIPNRIRVWYDPQTLKVTDVIEG